MNAPVFHDKHSIQLKRCCVNLVDSRRTRSALHLSTAKIVFLTTKFLTRVFRHQIITQDKSQKRETPQDQRYNVGAGCSAAAASLVPCSSSCKSQDWRLQCVAWSAVSKKEQKSSHRNHGGSKRFLSGRLRLSARSDSTRLSRVASTRHESFQIDASL